MNTGAKALVRRGESVRLVFRSNPLRAILSPSAALPPRSGPGHPPGGGGPPGAVPVRPGGIVGVGAGPDGERVTAPARRRTARGKGTPVRPPVGVDSQAPTVNEEGG